ncbi:MAG: serine/threonine protein kinase [Deltaproteobacteria bacterium]|nr:serine/threonine protein kinase [Deltaproteobacteria bacterium]
MKNQPEGETQFFYDLTPERILEAVEALGFECTGRCLALNSMENRVYEVEVEVDSDKIKSPSERFRIVKFYRPGRWSREQIEQEHQFLFDLVENEIPVVAPLKLESGMSVHTESGTGIFFAVFPKKGGRTPDEFNDQQLEQVGRLLARMHGTGAAKDAPDRLRINPETYGIQNLEYLLTHNFLLPEIKAEYELTVREICKESTPLFNGVKTHRIHGDCHLGNLIWSDSGPFWVDFDDMLVGPGIQDIWLVVPGRDQESQLRRDILIDAYEQMFEFDHRSLKLIEPLRALRFIHFSAWIARRWEDPAFKRTFIDFNSSRYWHEQLFDLKEQLKLIQSLAN